MRKPLPLLLLLLSVNVLTACAGPFGHDKSSLYETYVRYVQKAREHAFREEHDAGCIELGKALQLLDNRFSDFQQEEPELDWIELKNDIQSIYNDSRC